MMGTLMLHMIKMLLTINCFADINLHVTLKLTSLTNKQVNLLKKLVKKLTARIIRLGPEELTKIDDNDPDDHNIFGPDPDLLIWSASFTDGIIASDHRD